MSLDVNEIDDTNESISDNLMPEAILPYLPKLGAQSKTKDFWDKTVSTIYADIRGGAYWYVLEGEKRGIDYLLFTLAKITSLEFGYTNLSSIEALQANKVPIIREVSYLKPKTFRELKELGAMSLEDIDFLNTLNAVKKDREV